jgi:hypothetical protein
MPTAFIRVDMPPTGVLEITGNGSSPTDEQMAEEQQARQAFLDAVSPKLAALPRRPPKRAGNISRVELLGSNVWSRLNHYLLLVTYDIGRLNVDWASIMPPGAKMATIDDSYTPLDAWSEAVEA